MKYTEADEQAALFEWAAMTKWKYPDLKLLFHIPNEGQQHLTRQGVKGGVPDLFLPVPRGIYHGLFIEMKARQGRVLENQKMWLRWLTAQGYRSAICWGFDEARKTIEDYLNE